MKLLAALRFPACPDTQARSVRQGQSSKGGHGCASRDGIEVGPPVVEEGHQHPYIPVHGVLLHLLTTSVELFLLVPV